MSRSLLLVAAFVALPSVGFAGPSKAWTAAKKVHADAPILAGIDVATAKSSESFKKFFPLLLQKKPEAKVVLDRLQKECSFDPFAAVSSIVAVIDDKGGANNGAFFIALNGWDAKKVGECAQKVAASEKKDLKLGPITKGIQELEMTGKDEKIYLGWIGTNVLVFATAPTDRAFVESMIRGKGTGEAHKLANKLDTSATVWMSIIKAQQIQPGIEMKAVYGTVKITKGNVAVDGRVVTGDKQQAADLVTAANKELPGVQKGLPPAAQALVQSLKLKASGAEVQATAGAPETDVIALLTLMSALL